MAKRLVRALTDLESFPNDPALILEEAREIISSRMSSGIWAADFTASVLTAAQLTEVVVMLTLLSEYLENSV